MQPVDDMYSVGSVIQERYQIKDILGQGGFGIVYLVRDRLSEYEQERPDEENLFALKMLIDRDKNERARFLFEGEILTRLNHPALPHIHKVFEIESSHQACVLMDYIDGTNLDNLRRRPIEEHLSLSEALDILAPIVEALTYLHTQPSPIIHRDVKPANVIVKTGGNGAVLVDFGIAKEFELDATTTAIRHCTPGYGAPEQYGSIGTNQRTDVYGLGATLYALLTGEVPVDALQRLTSLASKVSDPLIPINAFIPTIPVHIADAIHRAMCVDMQRRFSSVKEFWQALHEVDRQRQHDSRGLPYTIQKIIPKNLPSLSKKPLVHGRLRFAELAFLLLVSVALGLGAYFGVNHGTATTYIALPHIQHVFIDKSAAKPFAETAPSPYPAVAQVYQGKIHNMLTNMTTTVTLTHIEQNNERISGSFNGRRMRESFSGVLDVSRHIFFTVSGQSSLFFEGAIRSDGNLIGNFCSIDAGGQCIGGYGIWSFAPVP